MIERADGLTARVPLAGEVASGGAFYAAADCFVLPSEYEAFPLVSLEAAAAGLPLLIARVNGVAELLTEGVNGWFIERDATVIADRFTKLAADPGLLRSIGAAARQVAAGFDWQQG